jgi:hypothetical protein
VRIGLLFADNRCELCPLRDGPRGNPTCHASKLTALVRAILDNDLVTGEIHP